MFVLREYQQKAVQSIYDYFAKNDGNPLIALPTGTGKSLVIADFIRGVMQKYPSQRIMMLTHVKELIKQNYDKFLKIWPSAPVGIYSAGLNKKQHQFPITFAGIGSVYKKAVLFGRIDLVIVDEAHRINPKQTTMYNKFFLDLKIVNPKLKVIGLTATPYRLGTGLLTESGLFTDICFNMTTTDGFRYFLAKGYLAPLTTKRPKYELNVEDVKKSGGEYVLSQLQVAVDKDEITRIAVKEIMETAYYEKRNHCLIFATGIEHCLHISDILEEHGQTVCVVHSKLAKTERDANIAGFIEGKYQYCINNNVLTTGFDFPGIDLLACLRPTLSTSLWVQMLGRGTRPCNGKANCLVLDFAGNTRKLGTIDNPVLPRKKGQKQGGQAPIKVCQHCATYNHASARVCAQCGKEFKFQTKIRHKAYTEEVMSTELPIVKPFKVDKIVYTKHSKQGRPDSIKVVYYCGLNCFKEFVCLEHPGYAAKKAREWWRQRSDTPPPQTTNQALKLVPNLKTPKEVNVWINCKYPQIMSVDF